ncbi:RNA polymerase, sigma 54 subunit, RpoN [Caldalkalibacillus thermarum TA2.A1]|uniref:RNA polymerase factor sigma-54 n=1 Tax=Caldalkalibacillus thermarum (strain TA2.A1) TaxID=986075 RepID=F5L4M5_CALTT|nr:RNA polymerase factor sigma-54 [Caldalkalibacillus thermarum]EGL83719.1 RNA polymerase, sigma 54 subunit, RpoN [Caldalkalibacillus thermarum TA2.A1]QZT33888.1 RNA polymerase factor sigma-54 [Caldalkalibacillus thermarum TA2.A1]
MDVGFRLVQEQQLKLAMTPELRQAITLLQYPALDLIPYLQEQAQKNPLLEIEEPDLVKSLIRPDKPPRKWEEEEEDYSIEYAVANDEYVNPIDYYAEKEITLQQYVLEQIHYLQLSEEEKQVLIFMVGNLDENGYLDADYERIASVANCARETWDNCLVLLQQLEPYGVGARNLEECLLIQLRHSPYHGDQLCQALIENHLADIAAKRYSRLARKFNTTVEEIKQRVEWIKSFSPKPGSVFLSQKPKYIVPDVFVECLPDGRFVFQVNDSVLPRIHFNREYALMLAENRQAKKFLEQKVKEYEWLKRGIEQRKKTILHVTQVIVERQKAFFDQGEAGLKPLTLKEVAQELGMHESTISRATNQKYMQTPRGLYELKFFFTQGVAKQNGELTSDAQIKEMIKQLIAAENKRKPLSDQKIAQHLQAKGISIARRTVAKYRDELGILSSSRRKEV